MVIGEAPGATEDEAGVPFIGRSGQVVREALLDAGIDPDSCYITNAVNCRPPENKTPTSAQIRECRYWVQERIKAIKPKYVLLLGNVPLESALGFSGIKKARGNPITKDGIIYLPTFHPAYVLRDPRAAAPFETDLKLFARIIREKGTPKEDDMNVVVVDSWSKVRQMLDDMRGSVSYDLETNDLYPWTIPLTRKEIAEGLTEVKTKKVVSLQIGTRKTQYVLLLNHESDPAPWSDEDKMKIIHMIDDRIKHCIIITHNGKFDALWMLVHYAVRWMPDFDTMLAHYLLDENSLHSLKVLSQVYLGAMPYDIDVEAKQGGGGLAAFIKYGAKDVYYTRKLKFVFEKMLAEDTPIQRVFTELLMPCVELFVEAEYHGVYIDESRMDEVEVHLQTQIDEAEVTLNTYAAKVVWDVTEKKFVFRKVLSDTNKVGGKRDRYQYINWGSSQQLGAFLYSHLKLKIIEKTEGGAPSTSESVLLRTDHEIAKALLSYRAAQKQLTSFIDGWRRFLHESRLHPSFKLHGTVTGRLSCLSAGTPVMIPGGTKNIEDIVSGDKVYCYDKNKKLTIGNVSWSGKTGTHPVYRVRWRQGNSSGIILATGDHRFRLSTGKYRRVDQLEPGDHMMALARRDKMDRPHAYPELRIFGDSVKRRDEHRVIHQILSGEVHEHVHHVDENIKNNDPHNLEGLTRSDHTKLHQTSKEASRRAHLAHAKFGDKIIKAAIVARKKWSEEFLPRGLAVSAYEKYRGRIGAEKLAAEELGVSRKTLTARLGEEYGYRPRNNHVIESIELLPGHHEVYDITVDKHHNFIANEICVHNCENPNLQQVPRDRKIRTLITAPKGWVLLEADLSQIEMRIAAELSGDRALAEAYRNGIDVHWLTAIREIGRSGAMKDEVIKTVSFLTQKKGWKYGDAIEELIRMGPDAAVEAGAILGIDWKEVRKKAKAINFGYLYGMWWKKFITYARDNYGVNVSDRDAENSRIAYFELYSDLPEWHRRQKRKAKVDGYVRSLTGRKRRLPDALRNDGGFDAQAAERQAINSPVQSFANDINLMAALQIRREFGPDVLHIIGTVHDAILMEVREDMAEVVYKRVLEIMSSPELFKVFNIHLAIPIEADAGLGPWGSGVSLDKWKAARAAMRTPAVRKTPVKKTLIRKRA